MNNLQTRIAKALADAGIKPIELAKRTGVSRATVSLWVNGPTQSIQGDTLTRVARVLSVDPHWLATGESKQHTNTVAEDRAEYTTNHEKRLVLAFNKLPPIDQKRAIDILEILAKTYK